MGLSQASNMTQWPRMAAFRATYTTPADTVARDSCNGLANMLVVKPGYPR
jgi:hypothetical protein